MTEEGDSGGGEDTLVAVDGKASFLKTDEQLAYVLDVDVVTRACHKDVIKIYKKERQPPQNAIH